MSSRQKVAPFAWPSLFFFREGNKPLRKPNESHLSWDHPQTNVLGIYIGQYTTGVLGEEEGLSQAYHFRGIWERLSCRMVTAVNENFDLG